jgi:hypothetical protein
MREQRLARCYARTIINQLVEQTEYSTVFVGTRPRDFIWEFATMVLGLGNAQNESKLWEI